MRKVQALLCAVLLVGVMTPVQRADASAGYYPVMPGEILVVEVCLPKAASDLIYLQGSDIDNNFKTFAKFKPRLYGSNEFCSKNEKNYGYSWKVNTKGGWSLSFYSPKTKKRYYGWPDGIESK